MKLKTRLQKTLGPLPCYGPPIQIDEVYEGEEPPDVPPCPCGSKHLDRVHQIVVVLKKSDAATTEMEGGENPTSSEGGSEPCA